MNMISATVCRPEVFRTLMQTMTKQSVRIIKQPRQEKEYHTEGSAPSGSTRMFALPRFPAMTWPQ